jgi:hypothetical protein
LKAKTGVRADRSISSVDGEERSWSYGNGPHHH